jgi:hypothetical protein
VADGVFGPRSRAAIRQYQRAAGAPPTGFLTADQAGALQAAAAALPPPAPPEPEPTAEPDPPPEPAPPADTAADEPQAGAEAETACTPVAAPAFNLRRVETTGSRGLARRRCNEQVDQQLQACLAAGGRIEPYEPFCQCEGGNSRVVDCSFDPSGRIPPFTCELPESQTAQACE